MIGIHFHDTKPIPNLKERIGAQKEQGGRLVLHRRAWSALVVTFIQDRIEHVPMGNRRTGRVATQAFTVLLGI